MNAKTAADLLFEEYLSAQGHHDYGYEVALTETTKIPDYQLPWEPNPLLFEVKGFSSAAPTLSGYFDPYPPLRKKINKAAEKFKDLEKYSCSLVLHHGGPGLIFLDSPFIFGAMLGEIATEFPFDRERGRFLEEQSRQVFTKRGRMIEYGKGGRPVGAVNTTINAVIVVEHYPLGQRRFGRYYDSLKANAGQAMTAEGCWREVVQARGTERDVSLQVPRVVVHDNPFARIPLPRELFLGACDERYAADEVGQIVRVYAGEIVKDFDQPQI